MLKQKKSINEFTNEREMLPSLKTPQGWAGSGLSSDFLISYMFYLTLGMLKSTENIPTMCVYFKDKCCLDIL